jgi:hypothetical protein
MGENIVLLQSKEPSCNEESTLNDTDKPIPRYLQLARAIHARFTANEEKKKAI